MFTKDIKALEERGFVLTKLPTLQTQITHKEPFVVESTNANVPAVLLEDVNLYSMIFNGYPLNNELQEAIQQHSTPLIHMINVSPDKEEDEKFDHAASFKALFSDIKIGDKFTKEDGGCGYTKVTETTCTKEGSEHLSNLKSWPFKKPQKCFELHSMHAVDWATVAAEQQESDNQ